jgi:hypothetical protein
MKCARFGFKTVLPGGLDHSNLYLVQPVGVAGDSGPEHAWSAWIWEGAKCAQAELEVYWFDQAQFGQEWFYQGAVGCTEELQGQVHPLWRDPAHRNILAS